MDIFAASLALPAVASPVRLGDMDVSAVEVGENLSTAFERTGQSVGQTSATAVRNKKDLYINLLPHHICRSLTSYLSNSISSTIIASNPCFTKL